MAVTSEITTRLSANQPDGWTNPVTTIVLADPVIHDFKYDVAVSGIAHAADESQGLTDLLANIKTHVDGTYFPNTLHVCATEDVDAIIEVRKISRANSQSSIYVLGEERYYVEGKIRYE